VNLARSGPPFFAKIREMRWIVSALIFLSAPAAHAGFIELGGSANYRSSAYDSDNYIQSLTYTASFSYYFWEMCAWELNYTTGYAKQATKANDPLAPRTTVEDNIEMFSMDLVLSFAGRQDPIRPYIKMGGGYLMKERFRQVEGFDKERIGSQEGIVPSGGLGIAVTFAKSFSIKFGADAWTSPLNSQPVIVDYAGRAGISWMF
jgi:outer membrane protein W